MNAIDAFTLIGLLVGIGLIGILVGIFGVPMLSFISESRQRRAILFAITDLERLNEVLSAGIADRVRVREIIEKLKGAVGDTSQGGR